MAQVQDEHGRIWTLYEKPTILHRFFLIVSNGIFFLAALYVCAWLIGGIPGPLHLWEAYKAGAQIHITDPRDTADSPAVQPTADIPVPPTQPARIHIYTEQGGAMAIATPVPALPAQTVPQPTAVPQPAAPIEVQGVPQPPPVVPTPFNPTAIAINNARVEQDKLPIGVASSELLTAEAMTNGDAPVGVAAPATDTCTPDNYVCVED